MSKLIVYEHGNMQGNRKAILVNELSLSQVYSLSSFGMNDRISSMEWDIEDGYKFIFYEHAEGQGRQYAIAGKGFITDLKTPKDFNDKASSFRYVINDSIPEYFDFISAEPKIIKFNSEESKHGTDRGIAEEHYQGIQVIDDKHVIICMSDFSGAYFFIVRWDNGLLAPGEGHVIKQVLINKDFPGMQHNHPGCMQVLEDIVAIPIEFIGDTDPGGVEKSVIVFYDISDRENPVKIDMKIPRQDKPAAALAMIHYKDGILLAVAGRDGQDIDFYQSQSGQTKVSDKTIFGAPFLNWKWDKNAINTNGWSSKFWGTRYESINFIKDSDNKLYLVAFRYPQLDPLIGGALNYFAELYNVNTDEAPRNMLKKLSVKELHCKEGVSTEFASGVYMANKKIHFLISGSGRGDKEYDMRTMKLNYF